MCDDIIKYLDKWQEEVCSNSHFLVRHCPLGFFGLFQSGLRLLAFPEIWPNDGSLTDG